MQISEIAKGVKVFTSIIASDGREFGSGVITGDHRFPNLGDRFAVKFDRFPFPQDVAIEAVGRVTITK